MTRSQRSMFQGISIRTVGRTRTPGPIVAPKQRRTNRRQAYQLWNEQRNSSPLASIHSTRRTFILKDHGLVSRARNAASPGPGVFVSDGMVGVWAAISGVKRLL